MDKIMKKLCELEDAKLIKWKIKRRGLIIVITIEETKKSARANSNIRNIGGRQVHIVEVHPFFGYRHYISMAHWVNNERKQYSEVQILNILEKWVKKNRKPT